MPRGWKGNAAFLPNNEDIEMKTSAISVEKVGSTPASWGGRGVLFINGVWWSQTIHGLTEYRGPVENVSQGQFSAKCFGATAQAGLRFINNR